MVVFYHATISFFPKGCLEWFETIHRSRGCNVCEVCVGKFIMSKPQYCANFIDSKVTCEPCPSKANRWQLNGDMPLGIDFIKNERNSLNRKQVVHFFNVAIMFLIFNL
jgi:hypothetical protein